MVVAEVASFLAVRAGRAGGEDDAEFEPEEAQRDEAQVERDRGGRAVGLGGRAEAALGRPFAGLPGGAPAFGRGYESAAVLAGLRLYQKKHCNPT